MEKKALRSYIRQRFKEDGFQSQKSINYTILQDDYLIAVELYPCTYGKQYQLICGVIFLPDEQKLPLRGIYDYECNFRFPLDPGAPWDPTLPIHHQKWGIYLKYELYTQEQLAALIDYNIEQVVKPLYDKEAVLDVFRSNWKMMNRFSAQTVEKLCRFAGLDTQEVLAALGKLPK